MRRTAFALSGSGVRRAAVRTARSLRTSGTQGSTYPHVDSDGGPQRDRLCVVLQGVRAAGRGRTSRAAAGCDDAAAAPGSIATNTRRPSEGAARDRGLTRGINRSAGRPASCTCRIARAIHGSVARKSAAPRTPLASPPAIPMLLPRSPPSLRPGSFTCIRSSGESGRQ